MNAAFALSPTITRTRNPFLCLAVTVFVLSAAKSYKSIKSSSVLMTKALTLSCLKIYPSTTRCSPASRCCHNKSRQLLRLRLQTTLVKTTLRQVSAFAVHIQRRKLSFFVKMTKSFSVQNASSSTLDLNMK